jgi:hypothetical protein
MLTKGAFAPLAYIKPLFFPVTQIGQEEMQIADSTTRYIGLTGYLPVTLE